MCINMYLYVASPHGDMKSFSTLRPSLLASSLLPPSLYPLFEISAVTIARVDVKS